MAEDYYAILDRVDELMDSPGLSEDENEEMLDLVEEASTHYPELFNE